MTLASTGTLSIQQINAEFGRGNDLNSYRGTTWYKDDGTSGTFPAAPNIISIWDFYGKRATAPYTNYYIDITSSKTITLPSYISGNIAVLVIAGGGGGGGVVGNGSATLEGGGGGGAGGIIWKNFDVSVVPSGTLTITIGSGGPGSYFDNPQYGQGGNTVIVHKNTSGVTQWTYTATGGGYGAMGYGGIPASSGGSGGGGSPWYGASLQGAGTAGQGNNGARGIEDRTGGGGGGHAAAGSDYGSGGAGTYWSNYGFSITAGGGGGGSGDYRVTTEGPGGAGGGGQGGIFRNGFNGVTNLGGGGGGAWGGTGGNGGSGRVVIWLTASPLPA